MVRLACVWTTAAPVRGLGWTFTFLFCDKMDKVNHLMSKGNAKMVPIISAGAMPGAFANLASGNFFTAEGSSTTSPQRAGNRYHSGSVSIMMRYLVELVVQGQDIRLGSGSGALCNRRSFSGTSIGCARPRNP
ncbi:MAG: DUF5058 family protein [Enterocloster bolteae]